MIPHGSIADEYEQSQSSSCHENGALELPRDRKFRLFTAPRGARHREAETERGGIGNVRTRPQLSEDILRGSLSRREVRCSLNWSSARSGERDRNGEFVNCYGRAIVKIPAD